MTGFIQDIRYAMRTLRKSPGFLTIAVLTLALGIAANTVIFSVMNATLFKPLPFPHADRLALVWETFGGSQDVNIISAPNYWDFKIQNHVFDDIAILDSSGRGYNLSSSRGGQEPEQVSGLRVSSNFFNVLGIAPLLGRTFLPEEEIRGKDQEVVLSYGLWKRRYGADTSLVGKTIKVDGEDFTVIGVMPSDFYWQIWGPPRQLWVPVGYTDNDRGRDSNSFLSIARLKPGVTLAQAKAEMGNIGTQLSQQYPKELAGMSATVQSMSESQTEGLRTTMIALFAAVGFVLLIACVNIANLLLARGAGRTKELALRRALGADGFRIARQLMTESVLLALLGGGVGLLLAAWGTSLLPAFLPEQGQLLPFRQFDSIPIDHKVLIFTLVVSCMTGILFGLAPALTALRGDMNQPLKDAGRGSSGRGGRLRHVLVASEVALALVVLCGAGLMIESMSRLLSVNPGFNPKNVLTMQLSLPQEDLYVGPPGHANFCRNLSEQVGGIPGVVSVGATGHLPMVGDAGRAFKIEGRPTPPPDDMPHAHYSVACPDYFKTMGIPLLEGREFNQLDTLGSPGAIVINQAMAEKYWPHEDSLGKRIYQNETWLTIVGIVRDYRHWGLSEDRYPQFFRPYTQAAWPIMNVVVRTSAAPMSLRNAVKKAMSTMEPDRPVSNFQPMEEIVAGSVQDRRFPMLLLSGFAVLALALAAVGIVGVVGYSVAQRTHEIGIRMALGARPGDVLKLVVSGSMNWVLAGIGFGIVGAIGLTRLLGRLLFEVKPANPEVLGIVSLLLIVVALVASYIPARRAAKVDPMMALRYE